MPLSCGCDWEPEPGDTLYYGPYDYTTLSTTRRKRCCSCGELISIGAIVAEVHRYRIPNSYVECNIYGEDGEILLAPYFLCEECADLCFSLMELGFCAYPCEDQHELVMEYAIANGSQKGAE